MDVNEIRSRILEISHDEDAPDTDLKAKSLRWLNSAYHELIDECMPYLERYLQKSEIVITDVNSEATLANDVYRISKVVDKNNNRTLSEKSYGELLSSYPEMDTSGSPSYFWISGNVIHSYPKAENISLEVVYLPIVPDLLEGDVADSILLPSQFHHALVWGGLVWTAIYERGFSSQSDITLFQRKWDDAKRNMKLSLASSSSSTLRVKPFEMV